MERLRAVIPGARVGITLNLSSAVPASAAAEDVIAARRTDGNLNRWFLDPLFGRGYPEDMLLLYGAAMPSVPTSELQEIAAPIDFLGINSYFPIYVHATPVGPGSEWGARTLSGDELTQLGFEITEMGWPVLPDAFRELLVDVSQRYRPTNIYVTENGASFADQVDDGAVHDPRRVSYLAGHLNAVSRAIGEGAPVRGYFVWSLLDNFEWAEGYSKRFGITYVDYASQQRIVKDSGRWYYALVRAHRGIGAKQT
jgi:beta-glucosidase